MNMDNKKNRLNLFPGLTRSAWLRLFQQGQVRTLADIAKALNDIYHYKQIDSFLHDFDETIKEYRWRGTVSHEVCVVMGNMIKEKERMLFTDDGYLDFDYFIELVDDLTYSENDNPLDAIYSRREKTKMLRLAALLNQIVHYTSADDLCYDLCGIASGRFFCGDNRYMNDSFWYPLRFFATGIKELWDEIQKDGYMNNELLEEKMFTEHERKVVNWGLNKVIEEDYEQDGPCYPEVYWPKRIGTAPVYVKDSFFTDHCTGEGKFVKSCGEGKGPNGHESLYEMDLVMNIIKRECEKGEYIEVGYYYLPSTDNTKPVFHKWHGIMRFDRVIDKHKFLDRLRHKDEHEDIR